MHAEELSALSIWLLADTEREGSLCEIDRMRQLMQALRFSRGMHTWNSFFTKFEHSIGPGELREDKEVFRFDCMRQIWLDRGL